MRIKGSHLYSRIKNLEGLEYIKINLPAEGNTTSHDSEEFNKTLPPNEFGLELEKMHPTDFYFVVWAKRAKCDFQFDMTAIHLKSNTLLFIRPGQFHTVRNLSKVEGIVFCFGEDFFSSLHTKTAQTIKFRLFGNDLNYLKLTEPETEKKLDDISKLLVSTMSANITDLRHKFTIYSLLSAFLLTITTAPEYRATDFGREEISSHRETYLTFIDLVNKYFRKHHIVQDYLGILGISQKQLAICTNESVGKTPLEIINDRVLFETKRLLLYTDLSIKRISEKTGFFDSPQFVNFFKSHVGVPPLQYRKKNAALSPVPEQP